MRRLGTRQRAEGARADLFDENRVTRQVGDERLAAGGAGEIGGDQRPLELEAGRHGLLDEPDPFEYREAATAPGLAAL